MIEILFVLTVLFVAYLLYNNPTSAPVEVANTQTPTNTPSPSFVNKPRTQPDLITIKPKPLAPVSSEPASSPAKNIAAAPVPAKPSATPPPVVSLAIAPTVQSPKKQPPLKREVRHPKTGEIANTYSNYRFTKRWVKEALVSEGLLPTIYKSNDLTDAIEENIKAALVQLAAMDKYRV